MVNNTETDETLKIRVMAISKQDLGKTLKRYKGTAWDQSPLFKKLYEEEYGQFGGEPFGALVGDYHFRSFSARRGTARRDIQDRGCGHAPFITGAAPSVMQMDSWGELANPRDSPKIFTTPEYAAWRSLRESDDARYLAMCMPRFLGRLPYGPKTSPVDAFNFEEDTDGADHNKYAWCNAGVRDGDEHQPFVQGIRLVLADPRRRVGGRVENLPTHTFPTDDGWPRHEVPDRDRDLRPARGRVVEERLPGDDPSEELRLAAFIGAQSLQKPAEYEGPGCHVERGAGSNDCRISLACNRFAHYLKCMVRDKVGSFKTREAMERWLNDWIKQYVDGDPANSTEHTQSGAAARCGGSRHRRGGRSAGLLPVQVLPETTLSVGRTFGVLAAGLQAAFRESRELRAADCSLT
jgi:type VI secretion system protein ImpC